MLPVYVRNDGGLMVSPKNLWPSSFCAVFMNYMLHCSRSSSFFLAVPPFPSRPAGCFLDNEFQFSIPVSSGDSVLSLFAPGATGLEVQLVDEDRSPLLQGELSPAEFLAHMELGPGEAAASCIKLEPAESFQCTGLKSCSVAGGGPGVRR